MWWTVLLIWCLKLTQADVCPQYCHCYNDQENLRTANCTLSALTSLTQVNHLDVLNLSPSYRSSHAKLSARIFKNFRMIKSLNMSNMTISRLPNDVFDGLNQVIDIDLSYNKIVHLNGVIFKDLGSLNTLILRGNPLNWTSWDAIVSKSLRELDLSYCDLNEIPPDTFTKVDGLKHLILEGNFLVTLKHNSLPSALTYLNLANNKISNVPTDVLTSLSHLVRLDLSKNPINCTCHLLLIQIWFSGLGKIFENGATCAAPYKYAGQKLNKIDQNELCKREFRKEKRISNDLRHFFREGHHHRQNTISDHDSFQGDQPYSDGENSRHFDSEVMFVNDDTRRLGSHMEFSNSYQNDQSDDVSTATDSTTDNADKETELGGTELSEPPQDLTKPDHTLTSESDHTVNESSETEITNGGTAPNEETYKNDDENVSTNGEEETSKETDFEHNSPSMESINTNTASASDYSNTIHALDTGNNTETSFPSTAEEDQREPTYEETETSETDLEPESTEGTENTDAESEGTDITNPSSSESDVEIIHASSPPSSDHSSKLLSADNTTSSEDFSNYDTEQSEESKATTESVNLFTWPSSPTENPDYSYDTQHDDYTSVETLHTTEPTESSSESSTNEEYTESPDTFSDDFEGSGEDLNVTLETSSSSTTVRWMEEQENETASESYHVEHVTEVFEDSTTESSTSYTSESVVMLSSHESTWEPTTETYPSSSPEPSSSPPTQSSTEQSSSSPTPEFPEYDDEIEEEEEGTSSTAGSVLSSSPSEELFGRESTTEPTSSLSPVHEVEILPEAAPTDLSEKLIEDSGEFSKTEKEEQPVESLALYIIAALVIVLVVLLVLVTACRRKRTVKVRLPADPEANPGTEMQDMLLPKPPENGIKVVPKNYTNGNTANGKPEQTKEEITPVLAAEPEPDPEPEPDWEDKLGPIEAVTARLSVLARPQTPIFIHKSLN